jgi:hypothetical protein
MHAPIMPSLYAAIFVLGLVSGGENIVVNNSRLEHINMGQ